MKNTDVLNRILCAVLVIALLLGGGIAVASGVHIEPDNPLKQSAKTLNADPLDGGGSADRQNQETALEEEPPEEEPPVEEPPEEQPPMEEPPQEQPDETAAPQEDEQQTEQSGDKSEETIDLSGQGEAPEDFTQPGEDPSNGDEPEPVSGEASGDDPSIEPGEDEGPDEPPAPPAPTVDETKIATDLPNGVITQSELPDGVLEFYAYGTGADDLSVRVQVRNTNSSNGTWLESADGRNWSFAMELGERYQFTLYLDQPGKPTKYSTRYVEYQATLANEDNPEVGEYPPFITTNIDYMADGEEIEIDNLTMIVTVRSNPDYEVITADRIAVTLNGVPVAKHGGDSSPEYDLFFEPPNVGDYKDYEIEIVAWYGNNSRYWSKTLRYHATAQGSTIGTVSIVLDATTVGVGILDEAEYEIVRDDSAADVFLRFLEDYGYEITYDSTGSNFYIRRIYRGDMCYNAEVPEELWEAILRDGINLNETQYDRDSLGEHDYTMGAGWMYAVDYSYPGRSMNKYEVKDGETIYVRFTLAYGKDIGGFDSTGGGYGSYNSYCGLWINGYYQELDHNYEETDRLEPTETESGHVEYTCSRCGKTYTEELPATGHQYEETARIEPTETEDGYIEYTCKICGETYREVLPATGHQYEETDRLDPTETEDGYVEYTCTICGETYREVLPATGHQYEETARVLPTETEDGYIEYTCKFCGDTYRVILPATGSGEMPDPGGGDEDSPPEEGGEGDDP